MQYRNFLPWQLRFRCVIHACGFGTASKSVHRLGQNARATCRGPWYSKPASPPAVVKAPSIVIATVVACKCITAADFNNDGNPDVLVSTGSPLTVESFLGRGNGVFSHFVGATAQFFSTIGAFGADFNGDGKLDIVTLGGFENVSPFRQGVTMGNGDGTFKKPSQFHAGVTATSFRGLGIGDFNNDGKLDVVAYSQNRTFLFLQK